MYNLTKLIKSADSEGIEIYFVPDCDEAEQKQARTKVGIHLIAPNNTELSRAIDDAVNKGFSFIYIHNQAF